MKLPHVLLLLAAYALGGCASGPIGAHQPSMTAIQTLQQSGMATAAVGDFAPAAELPAGRDKSVSVRGHTLSSPASGSFAAYLKEAVVTDLRSAGKYDPAAKTVISGQLTRNDFNGGGVSTGNATLAAKFAVKREGTTVYDKLVDVTHEWSSSFVGAIAIPEAINQYTQMYTRLVEKLYADEEFKKAVTAK